ncbi:MAG: biopolymer transporter ExbD [Flavobacteriales bacterium]|nr:biopolymer transporter ExbD [Flavobacteriales bacterium]
MAELNPGSGGSHKKDGKIRAKKHNTKVDMTPMVDLAFLLLTFFVLTSTFSKPKTMEITFPVPPEDDVVIEPMKVNGYTFILTKDDRVFWYNGEFKAEPKNGMPATVLNEVKFGEDLNKLLLDKNDMVAKEIKDLKKKRISKEINDSVYKELAIKAQSNKEAPFFVIKADDKAVYRNLIDIIDEFNICNIGKYAVTDIIAGEMALLKQATE